MWIDYKKAYDSIPHSWIEDMMDLYKIDETIIAFITTLMPQWRTKIYLPHEDGCITTKDIPFNKGIFQGDTLSPLIFCLALAPLTNILRRAKVGYKIGKAQVSILKYIDDLKIFGRSPEEIEQC